MWWVGQCDACHSAPEGELTRHVELAAPPPYRYASRQNHCKGTTISLNSMDNNGSVASKFYIVLFTASLRKTDAHFETSSRRNSSKEAVISDKHIRADRLTVRLYETPLRSIKDRYYHAPSPRPAQNYSSLEGILLTSIGFHGKRTVPASPWTMQKSMIELPMAGQIETDLVAAEYI